MIFIRRFVSHTCGVLISRGHWRRITNIEAESLSITCICWYMNKHPNHHPEFNILRVWFLHDPSFGIWTCIKAMSYNGTASRESFAGENFREFRGFGAIHESFIWVRCRYYQWASRFRGNSGKFHLSTVPLLSMGFAVSGQFGKVSFEYGAVIINGHVIVHSKKGVLFQECSNL